MKYMFQIVREDCVAGDISAQTVAYTVTIERAINVINALTGFRHDSARLKRCLDVYGHAGSAELDTFQDHGAIRRYWIYKIELA